MDAPQDKKQSNPVFPEQVAPQLISIFEFFQKQIALKDADIKAWKDYSNKLKKQNTSILTENKNLKEELAGAERENQSKATFFINKSSGMNEMAEGIDPFAEDGLF